MATIRIYRLLIGFMLILFLTPTNGFAGKSFTSKSLPLPVQVVLAKVGPMMQNREYQKAIDTLQAFSARSGSSLDPGKADPKGYQHAEIYFCMGNCYLLQEQHEPAIAAYENAVKRDNTHSYAWLNLAKAHYELDHFTEAGRCFGKGYETSTEKNPEYLYYSAAAYLMAEDNLRAIDIFENLFALHPDAVKLEWKEHMVHALLAADQPRRALPFVQELAQAYTGDKQIQWQEILLQQYMQLNMQDKALDLAHTLTRQTPTFAKWWKALTHIQLNAERYEDALMAMTIYAFITPLSLDEKRLLADLNLQLNVPVKAAPLYENCLRENHDKQILEQLAMAYRQLGKPETALAAIDEMEPEADDADIMLLKGELYYSLKQYGQAVDAYEKAARKKGRHVGRAWLMAGYAAWQMNDLTTSKKAFTEAACHQRQREAANTALKQLAMLSQATVGNIGNQ